MDKKIKEKKQRGPLFWVIMVFVLFLFLGLCCCGGSIFTISNLFEEGELQETFTREYCSSLEREDYLNEDPFGWCD